MSSRNDNDTPFEHDRLIGRQRTAGQRLAAGAADKPLSDEERAGVLHGMEKNLRDLNRIEVHSFGGNAPVGFGTADQAKATRISLLSCLRNQVDLLLRDLV